MSTPQEENIPGPLELIESARTKYTLALARVRRGPPELALLSLHGSLEDTLRAHGLRLRLPEAAEPFPQLLDALVTAAQHPLSSAEAEGVRRMHRLRARVAHGEQIAVARETIDAYHRLVARLLPRYGVIVIAPEDPTPGARSTAVTATGQGQRGDTAVLRRDLPETRRRGDTMMLDRDIGPSPGPRRERTVYPDASPARYVGRPLPSGATRDLPLAREMLAQSRGRGGYRGGNVGPLGEFWARSQTWLLPALIALSIFLVGAVISVSLQQMRAAPVVPTAVVPTLAPVAPVVPGGADAAPGLTTPPAPGSDLTAASSAQTGAPAAQTAGPATAASEAVTDQSGLAVGRTAYVLAEAGALNVRARPGTGADNAVQVILQPGTAVEIIGGPVVADGYSWWQVRSGGAEGWCAGQYLEVR